MQRSARTKNVSVRHNVNTLTRNTSQSTQDEDGLISVPSSLVAHSC